MWRIRWRSSNRVGAVGQGGVHGLLHLREILGMDPLQPRLGRSPDLVLIAAHEAEPPRRKVDPVGHQIPIPEPFALAENAERI